MSLATPAAAGAKRLLSTPPGRRLLVCIGVCAGACLGISTAARTADSALLLAFSLFIVGDVAALLADAVRMWAALLPSTDRRSLSHTYGYDKGATLVRFAGAVLQVAGAAAGAVELPPRLLYGGALRVSGLVWTAGVAVAVHYGAVAARVRAAGESDSLVHHVACGVCVVVAALLSLEPGSAEALDATAGAGVLALLLAAAVPRAAREGALLLLRARPDALQQVEKRLRELATFEGVLEFQHHHFWAVGDGEMGGSVSVRVRRDADEQAVLAQVANKLAQVVPGHRLTVQVVKDDGGTPGPFTPLSRAPGGAGFPAAGAPEMSAFTPAR